MKKVVIAAIGALVIAPTAFGQSFNGAGRMSSSSPTGWAPNPNGFVGTPYANSYGNGFGNGFGTGLGYPGATGAFNNGIAAPVYPFGSPYVNPVALRNGLYTFNGGGLNANLWRAPSGYYYPWGAGFNNGYSQIIYVDQSAGRAQTVAQQPPLSSQFTDMGQFLDDARKNNKLSENDYQSLKRRLKDIQRKERSYRIAGDGYLEDNYDAEIKQNLKDLGKEITERIQL